MAGLYARAYGHDRTTATTYINDNVVVCILEDILSTAEGSEVAAGDGVGVIDRRVAFQANMQDEFTAEIERLTDRHVVAFLSGNQSSGHRVRAVLPGNPARVGGDRGCRVTVALASYEEADDAELMRRVQDDDAVAFAALYDRMGARAYRTAIGIAHNGARAEDIVQHAFLSIWRSRAAYQPQRGPVAGWVMGTVRNRAIDSLRHNRRHDDRRASGEHIDEQLQAPGDFEQGVAERDEAARLRGLLDKLPAAQREVIALAYFGELSTSEIARELTLPLGTVNGRMRLGLKVLRSRVAAA